MHNATSLGQAIPVRYPCRAGGVQETIGVASSPPIATDCFFLQTPSHRRHPVQSSCPYKMSGRVSLVRIVIFGDGGVGKTSLTTRFVVNHFVEEVSKLMPTPPERRTVEGERLESSASIPWPHAARSLGLINLTLVFAVPTSMIQPGATTTGSKWSWTNALSCLR
jgi:hypothetical protein